MKTVGRSTKKRAIDASHRKREIFECLSPNASYYMRPISAQKANEFNNGKRKRPLSLLKEFIRSDDHSQHSVASAGDFMEVVHWFRGDLRVRDNTGLSFAMQHAKEKPLQALYVINEHDWIAHMDSGWKLKFQLEALSSLGRALAKLGVKLHVRQFKPETPCLSNSPEFREWFSHTVEEITTDDHNKPNQSQKEDSETDSKQDQKQKHPKVLVTANLQYEVDELYRDDRIARHCADDESCPFKLMLFHDQCVVPPGVLTTGKGSQYTIFTPWYKKWVSYLEENRKSAEIICSEASGIPEPNKSANDEFHIDYELPEQFISYIPEEVLNIPKADEESALDSLNQFLLKKATKYSDDKDSLEVIGTSCLSCYISAGVISTRTIVQKSYVANNHRLMNKDIKKNNSLETFIKEVAWRDFYKHTICHWPFLSMDLPFKFETLDIRWENDESHFEQWCYGETGIPIVDAIMKKMLHTGYINNRARMITASFLSKNLLIDWRWGERWFRKHLIDHDVASNVGGWGFCSSTGVDCQPYFRVFNMTLQSQKYDPQGTFIKRWLDLGEEYSGKLHEPFEHAIVDLKDSRERALERYREVM